MHNNHSLYVRTYVYPITVLVFEYECTYTYVCVYPNKYTYKGIEYLFQLYCTCICTYVRILTYVHMYMDVENIVTP